jgi:hypothetical protein
VSIALAVNVLCGGGPDGLPDGAAPVVGAGGAAD